MSITKYLIICCLGLAYWFPQQARAVGDPVSLFPPDIWPARQTTFDDGFRAGPIYDKFKLTLEPGERKEIAGPFYYWEQKEETHHQWALPLLTIGHADDPATEYSEYDFLYPFITYDRFGSEYRWHIFQVFSFAGGQNPDDSHDHRFTLFPIYFQQRSTAHTNDYTAVIPFYGKLDHRLFRDEIYFVMMPCYVRSVKRGVTTYNMPYPFFHLRYGEGLHGWQVWPLVGKEHKILTTQTNSFGETSPVGGHDNFFVLWPFFSDSRMDTETDHPSHQQGLIPFYSIYRSKLRNSTSWLWPLGVTHTIDLEKKYDEWDAPWPLIEFARGEGKTTSRVWPFMSQSHNQSLRDDWYMWPAYKYNRVTSAPLDRSRMRIFFFLYSDVKERNTEAKTVLHRVDFFPFYTSRKDFNGNYRLQVMSIFEPFFPNNKSIERDYSQLWSFWRYEHSPKRDTTSQSLLWNLYRRDTTPGTKKISLLFGLFQYESGAHNKRWRVCYIPLGKGTKPAPEKTSGK